MGIKNIGYARISTDEQKTDLQVDALEKAGCNYIFMEQMSGASDDRPEFLKALKLLSPGDTFTVWKIDRASRSTISLIKLVDYFRTKKINFKSITEGIDTTTPAGAMIFGVMAALAQFERENIQERVAAGIAAAKSRGVKFGRKSKISEEKLIEARALAKAGTPLGQIAKLLGVHRVTLYRNLEVPKETFNDILK